MESPERRKTNDPRRGLVEKLLVTSLSSLLVGNRSNIKVRGNLEEMTAISNALLSSKILHEELQKPDASLSSVIKKLNNKRRAAADFERVIGIPWPL